MNRGKVAASITTTDPNQGGEPRGIMTENNDKRPIPATNGYMNRTDRRRRQIEHLLDAPFIHSNNFSPFKTHGEDPKIQFRISPFAEKVGSEVAALFGMTLPQYAKAVLYHNFGLVFESVDRRKKIK
jgi:hypothetical protein